MADEFSSALRLSFELESKNKGNRDFSVELIDHAIRELRRSNSFEKTCDEWIQKTEWLEATLEPKEFEMHRADVLKERIKHLLDTIQNMDNALDKSKKYIETLQKVAKFMKEHAHEMTKEQLSMLRL